MPYDRIRKLYIYIILVTTAVFITVCGVRYHQGFLRILPLYVSLAVAVMQSRVSRYASLVGSLNSLLYAYSSWYYGLMASLLNCIAVSFPLQMATFVLWQRNACKSSTRLRRMTWRQRLALCAAACAAWLAMFFILRLLGSNYQLLDNTLTLFSLLISVLYMFAFVEYIYLMIPSCIINIALYWCMMHDFPEQSTYFVFSIFSLYCNAVGTFRARALYAEQQAELNGTQKA